ncbi:putative disease resistance RPP13-like protein 1 [Ananas comosus]|uniref:Disease resistance RPP13-like protein 1 n=2 Tax=Ananas comosus TaxID=4615 RepID=A0A6P5FWE8_ANACO|nr:putative disease resistance RPP13-like protein 1 [Ananas comosus]XP_020097838.1 putative disease resistance RPP13-like protein 1 [Ananas comosus]CAD1842829.1 unnamed protein product [Ananas comosus var. bracteatus]
MAGVEPIILAALGWVASPLVAKLLAEGFASLGINAEKKLQKLRATVLPVLKSVIEKAEGSPHRSEVEGWLQRLKDAYDGAEDALDLLNYDRLRRKVAEAARSSGKRPTNPVRSSFFHIPKPVKWMIKGCRDMGSPQKIKLKRRLNKLEKIAGEAQTLRDLLGATAAPDRQNIAQPPQKVFGRDKDREEIIRRLKTEPAAICEPGSSSGIPIIAIVGRPGVGKTALAQYICEQLRSELGDGHFDLIMWVYASCDFNASEIMKNIIQQASIASESQDSVNPDDLAVTILALLRNRNTNLDTMVVGNLDSPEGLRLKMNKMLNAKNFLLVIDDVWCDGEDHKKNWKTLRCLSNCCLPGSKILVTSQMEDAPRKIGAAIGATIEHIFPLKDIEENYFSDLFIHHALPSGEIDSHLREELEEKCRTIARKLNKDPTAAEMVGETIATEMARLLRSQGNLHAYLRKIADEDWSGDKTKALMWSYRHLPAHLQRCFSYCSLYPRGHTFEALQLVQLWMAQGFIKPDDQNKRMEDVGNNYLNELVSRFYIQRHNRVGYSSGAYKFVSYYTLHELLYDLAEKVTRNYCVRIEGNHQSEIPSTIRHLCIPANKLNENKEEICKLEKLRTLIVTGGESINSKADVVTDISNSLKQFSLKKLRVLVLELNLENLAKFISEMKHLRVLQVSSTSEFVLPESVCTLYQLQVLRINCARLLPKFLNNLVSLRYLEANSDLISGIPDIGKLTFLQGLKHFQVKKEKGYELEQLQNLNELRGHLCIDNLENVESKDSAIAAKLKEKEHLDMLQLVWCGGLDNVNSSSDVEILEGLQLPPYLTSLILDGYRGRSCPSWPECQTSDIQELALRRCRMLEALPLMMDQIYRSCRSLELSHLSKLKALHALPPQLTILIIENTPSLIFVTNEDLQLSEDDKRSIREVRRNGTQEWFSHRYQESLVNNEKEMMNFIASMNGSNNNEASSAEHNKSVPAADVAITDHWERWLEIHKRKMELIYNRQNEAKLLLPSTLTELWLKGCNITNRALSASLQTLTSLTRLSLEEIRTVTSLPSEDVLGKLTSLQAVILRECWAVTSLGGIRSLPHLKELYLSGCPCLDSRTAFLPSSLEIITFESCADVDVILANTNLPRLSHLTIVQCDMQTTSLQLGDLQSLYFLYIDDCIGLSSLVYLQKLNSLECLILHNCSNLEAVMNLPMSLARLVIRSCPILEKQSVKIDPLSGRRILDGIPVEDTL